MFILGSYIAFSLLSALLYALAKIYAIYIIYVYLYIRIHVCSELKNVVIYVWPHANRNIHWEAITYSIYAQAQMRRYSV